jgi:GxxExxY protein
MGLTYPESVPLTKEIIGAAIEVHKYLGPGLLESAYDEALNIELTCRNVVVDRQRSIPLLYKSHMIQAVYRPDMIVSGLVVVEVKAVEKTLPVHKSQVLTYLKMTGLHVGFLFNFNVPFMTEGISRISH